MMDFFSEVYQTVFVLEEGKLVPLWKELMRGHGHEHTVRDQVVELRETPDGVILEAKTGKDSLFDPKRDEPELVRRWILRPRMTGLEPLQ